MQDLFVSKICENIYSFPVVLPDNPLKWLNCYVVNGAEGERSLLIDTGFKRPECFDALMRGMEALELKPELTDVFLSHVHSDHTGNAGALADLGCRIIMGEIDNGLMNDARWAERLPLFRSEGMPEKLIEQVHQNNPGMLFAPKLVKTVNVRDGDVLSYGGYELKCLHTPGHNRFSGNRQKNLFFLGEYTIGFHKLQCSF